MPEGVLGVEHAVLKHRIGDVLEGVFALHAHVPEGQMAGAHHKVFALHIAVLHGGAPYRPAELGGADVTAPQLDVRALPQGLDAVELRSGELHILAVPEGRPAQLGHPAVPNNQPLIVPEGIAQVEKAMRCFDIPSLFECALPVRRTVKEQFFTNRSSLP